HNTPVPTLKMRQRNFHIDFETVVDHSLINMAHLQLRRFGESPTHTYEAHVESTPAEDFETLPLSRVAELDTLLGFKGNYMIFALKESNALTDMMMDPYVDRALNTLIDPDDVANWTLDEFASYVCCLQKKLTAAEF